MRSYSMGRQWLALLCLALSLAMGVGVLGRGYWTPDEPREADIAWRMSWQPDKAVPLLAGEAFCEKPPLTYWVAGTAIAAWGPASWIARLPNLLYALVTALAVGALARRGAGPVAGWTAAAAITTLLLSYQVAIWLATDAPLLASVAVALLGLYYGYYASSRTERLRGYSSMHAALALGFLSKSAAAWMVPALTFVTLVAWERRWRELLRWEVYIGLLLQAAVILPWVWFVYVGPDGIDHLKVFFWNNLAGRFTHVDAPEQLQYAGAHKNSPGKYFLELPVYLWPWTLLVMAAIRRAWQQRHAPRDELQPVRFACATFLPTLLILSVAATARNIYLAPAFPGIALLLGWWASRLPDAPGTPDVPRAADTAGAAYAADAWDSRAIRATAGLLLLASSVLAVAVIITGMDSWDAVSSHFVFAAVSTSGLLIGAWLALRAWREVHTTRCLRASFALLLAYCALLIGPASQIYGRVNTWQDLAKIGAAIDRDTAGQPLILYTPDETTRAFIDMYTRTHVGLIPAPATAASGQSLQDQLVLAPGALVIAQMPGQVRGRALLEFAARLGLKQGFLPLNPAADTAPPWAVAAGLHIVRLYALPNGRRYALFGGPMASR